MTPFYTPLHRREHLVTEARSWVGTPFFGNSCAKGRGASCQMLAASLYRATGWLSPDEVIPEVPMSHARSSDRSLLMEWIGSRADLLPVESMDDLQPGDLLAFRMPRTVHHAGVYLGCGLFVQAIEGPGVVISPLADATWSSRFAGGWRPMK